MDISIIGAGNVGMALGKALIRRGTAVVYGSPRPSVTATRSRRWARWRGSPPPPRRSPPATS